MDDITEMPVPERWVSRTTKVEMEVFCKTRYNYFYRPVDEPELEMQLHRIQFEREFIPVRGAVVDKLGLMIPMTKPKGGRRGQTLGV